MPNSGDVYRDRDYPLEAGGVKPKYVVLLSPDHAGDWIAVLSTSQQHGRPKDPPCNRTFMPSFFVGAIDQLFPAATWLDLARPLSHEPAAVDKFVAERKWQYVGALAKKLTVAVLRCAADAPDFEKRWRDRILDTAGAL
jgi:hypothetical protein